MLAASLAGAGIVQIMALGVKDLLDHGRLIDLFPDWPLTFAGGFYCAEAVG